jgi:hypothetical protein
MFLLCDPKKDQDPYHWEDDHPKSLINSRTEECVKDIGHCTGAVMDNMRVEIRSDEGKDA